VASASARSFADLHCHSSASFDSLSSPKDLVKMAVRIGLSHLAITDHERIDGALRARDLAPEHLLVIVGEEVRTSAGDMLGLFLERPVPALMTPEETAAAIHEQGGLVGLPHPFDRYRSSTASTASAGSAPNAAPAAPSSTPGGAASASAATPGGTGSVLDRLARAVDFVEVHNARAFGRANELAALFAKERGLPGVASSDAHSLMEVGVAYTVLHGDFDTADELRGLLAGGELILGRASYYVRAFTPVAKVIQRMRGNGRNLPSHPPSGSA